MTHDDTCKARVELERGIRDTVARARRWRHRDRTLARESLRWARGLRTVHRHLRAEGLVLLGQELRQD
jgi:hypothetical protein